MPSELDIVLDRAPKTVEFRPLPRVSKTLPHRTDTYYQDQVRELKQSQTLLRKKIKQLETLNTEGEILQCQAYIKVLKDGIDKMLVMLKVTAKIYSELSYARERMHEAIRCGNSTEDIRKRMFWLEERLEKLLNKERSPQVQTKPAILPPPLPESTDGKDLDQRSFSDMMLELDGLSKKLEENAVSEDKLEEMREGRNELEETKEEKQEEENSTFLTECKMPDSEEKTVAKEVVKEASKLSPAEKPPLEQHQSRQDEDGISLQKVAEEASSGEDCSNQMAADTYWDSEHHKFRFVDNAAVLIDLDPSSYHNLAIAEPGSYVEDAGDREASLPWRPRRRDSEFEEIHTRSSITGGLTIQKDALNTLVKRVHNMYTDMHDAAMLSVDPHYKDETAKGTFLDHLETAKEDIMDNEELALPELKVPKKAGFGKVYYPTPLLAPIKLPTAKLDRSKIYPPNSSRYSKTDLGETTPAQRIVNQGTLYDETRFTSSLFHKRRGGRGQGAGFGGISSAEEKRLRDWVRNTDSGSAQSANGGVILNVNQSEDSRSNRSSMDVANQKGKKGFRNRVQAVRGAQKFARSDSMTGLWKQIKPKSGALQHSGLKWERIKEIVHHNLSSERPLERQDAARTLGLLKCADGMVLFALRKAMLTDTDLQTRYEATKALVLLGCWEENVLENVVEFLRRGDDNVKVFLLQAMERGKNVHFVDKGLPSFPKLSSTLSRLCRSQGKDVAFHAAVCLGKLCVADESAKHCLSACIQESKDDDRIIKACETLVRQMNASDSALVEVVLQQLRWSPAFKNRSLAARLLVLLGPKSVCPSEQEEDRVFALLETRLWDDPMKDVRLDIAKAIISLDMFPRACERAERKLESPDEDVRAQAVMAIGTLGIRNERIIRTLLEMLELDPSEYIRILVIRTFGAIGLADKRIIRSLQEKEKLETMFANRSVISNEARKSLKLLQSS